jgi:hypothetical protein
MHSNGIFTQIQGILITIAILTTILAVCHWFRVFRGTTDGNLVKLIQLLTLSIALFQGQQISIRNEMNDIVLIHHTDRVYLPFPLKKNRTIVALLEEDAYTWTHFTKFQLHQLYIHLHLPLHVISPQGVLLVVLRD